MLVRVQLRLNKQIVQFYQGKHLDVISLYVCLTLLNLKPLHIGLPEEDIGSTLVALSRRR